MLFRLTVIGNRLNTAKAMDIDIASSENWAQRREQSKCKNCAEHLQVSLHHPPSPNARPIEPRTHSIICNGLLIKTAIYGLQALFHFVISTCAIQFGMLVGDSACCICPPTTSPSHCSGGGCYRTRQLEKADHLIISAKLLPYTHNFVFAVFKKIITSVGARSCEVKLAI